MPTPITPAIIASLMTGFRADFKGGISDAPSQYKKNRDDSAVRIKKQHLRLAGQISSVP